MTRIRWIQAARTEGHLLESACPTRMAETLRRAFGESPWNLGPDALPVLHGIAAADPGNFMGWSALVETLRANDHIRVWSES